MYTTIRKSGNSSAVIIPKTLLEQAGLAVGDVVNLSIEEDRLILASTKIRVRTGWAEAAKTIADENDDALVWPEFANANEEDLQW
jgi:antitoxin MazE